MKEWEVPFQASNRHSCAFTAYIVSTDDDDDDDCILSFFLSYFIWRIDCHISRLGDGGLSVFSIFVVGVVFFVLVTFACQ
jgi:hypothetical protein